MGKFDNTKSLARVIRAAKQHLRPPPNIKPSQWAESNIKIPIGNAVPGFMRFDNAPYQREPLDMMIDPGCYRITLMWAAQVGKTQLALCGQAYHVAVRPSSQMMMQPSQGDLQVWMNTKFNPMVDANQSIGSLLAKPRGRDGVNNGFMKSYPGGFLMFAWSGSPKTMRGRSAPIIVADEVDGYESNDEGHPVSLLFQRAATFGDQRKLIEISTPTVKDQSYIEKAFESGDQRRFFVPCRHCGEHQVLRWDQVTWLGKDLTEADQQPETARYACNQCGALWDDGERKASIRIGEWRGAMPFKGHASYHLSELYSTFRNLRDIVQSYLDKLATDDLQTFVNVSLAETWEETGEQADPENLMNRAEAFNAIVPLGGLVLTAGADMQQDRIEVEVVAWGHGEESWSVGYYVLWGDPLQGDVWDELEALLSSTWLHESGAQLSITAACVDTGGTGGTTQAAYDWLRGKTGRRIFGIKGVPGFGKPIVSAPSRKKSGKNARKVDLFLVGVDEAKLIVMRRLAVDKHGPGYCHVPNNRGADWYQQITAEKLITRYSKGFPIREWHKKRPRNEALDCRVYALAALKIASPSMRRAAERLKIPQENAEALQEKPLLAGSLLERSPEKKAEALAFDAGIPPQKRPVKPKRKRGGWVGNW